MELLATTGASLLLVNLAFAAIALGLGFAAGAWICGRQPGAPDPERFDASPTAQAEAQQLVAERTALVGDRLRDLAVSVATDVGAHNASIGEIEARLTADRNSGSADAETVLHALTEIENVNQALHSKLAKAEQQIQSQAELIRAHESEARTDSLTGLANRRAFDNEINRRFAEWQRNGTYFSLLFLDVDHFKRFNDTHGHQAGDEVLRQVGRAITRCAREMDCSCRYGGEEFAVVMPATDGHDGSTLAERIRLTIEDIVVPFEGKQLSVTTSVGLASVREGDAVETVIKRADEALYASKDAGRNNSHRHTGAETVSITPGKANANRPRKTPAEESLLPVLDGLPNRTRFLELLRNEVRVAQETAAPLSLLTIEFKGYATLANKFGESVARLTLDSIAQFLDDATHEGDLLGRLEDGKFVVLMPGHGGEGAEAVGARINTALSSCSVPLGDTLLRLSTKMSVTTVDARDTAVSLMKRADETHQLAEAESPAPATV